MDREEVLQYILNILQDKGWRCEENLPFAGGLTLAILATNGKNVINFEVYLDKKHKDRFLRRIHTLKEKNIYNYYFCTNWNQDKVPQFLNDLPNVYIINKKNWKGLVRKKLNDILSNYDKPDFSRFSEPKPSRMPGMKYFAMVTDPGRILHKLKGGCKKNNKRPVYADFARAIIVGGYGRLCKTCWSADEFNEYLVASGKKAIL